MSVFMHHTAVYASDLEKIKTFYETYFDASANAQYHNPKTGLRTYFLSFADGAKLEIMSRPDMNVREKGQFDRGLIHVAFALSSREAVDQLTARLRSDGYTVLSGPRVTGDGYYESCVLDPEGNQVEIVQG